METLLTGTNLTYLGLVILIAGWLIQFFSMSKKNKSVSPWFVFVYSIGVLLLVIGGFMSNMMALAALNMASVVATLLVMLRLK